MKRDVSVQASQIRAARALLNWSQKDLVDKAGLSLTTVRRMEDEKIGPGRSSVDNAATVRAIFEWAGIIFIDEGSQSNHGGPGVRIGE